MASDALVGTILHDTHEVLRLIGKGGMGSVYEARHVLLNKSFAIKVLDPRFAENDTVFARFRREALIASSLGHPAIVQVVDFYLLEDGRPCMVMEYLEGKDLGDVLKERKTLPPVELVQIVEQVAGALKAVHEEDIIHRDMKPGNIFLADKKGGGFLTKVLDFGISKIKNPDDGVDTLTADQAILGTPHFMSPEQAMGEVGDVDWRTDIFALATICYYALSGKLPFNAPSLHGVLVKIESREPPPITGLVPGLSGKVHLVLQKAMAKDKADRYEQVEQFAAEFCEALTVEADSGLDEESASDTGMATRVDMQPVSTEGDEPAQEQLPLSDKALAETKPEKQIPAQEVDPNLTNVLPLDELVREQEGEPDEETNKVDDPQNHLHAADDSPTQDESKAGDMGEPAVACAQDEMVTVEPPASLQEQAEDGPARPEAEITATIPPPTVSLDTTLSGSTGETSSEQLRSTSGNKQHATKLLAAAAVMLLAAGGLYWMMKSAGELMEPGDAPARQLTAASRPDESMTSPPAVLVDPSQVHSQPQGATPKPSSSPKATSSSSPISEVAITLQLKPPTARVLLDGESRSDNPLVLKRTDKPHQLVVTAKGYMPLKQQIDASRDQTLELVLTHKRPLPSSRKKSSHQKQFKVPGSSRGVARPEPGPKKPAKKIPFEGDLDEGEDRQVPEPKKPPPEKKMPFSGEL